MAATVAQQFIAARAQATGLPDYPGGHLPDTLAQAYAVQDAAIALAGAPIGGWKVGRILPPKTEVFGADRLAGPIFSATIAPATPNSIGLIFADGFGAAEAEFLVRLGPVPAGRTRFSLDEAAALIEAVHIGIEIASSPFTGINAAGPAATVSDFGNNNGLLVGPAIADWRSMALLDQSVETRNDGVVVGTGHARAFTDGIIGSTRFLLENCAARAISIAPGCWISSGAVTGVHRVRVGQRVEADFGPLGTVVCTIGAQGPSA